MKTAYFVILSRPKGNKCWLPIQLRLGDREAGNFFASRENALQIATEIAKRTKPVWLKGARQWAPLEFKIAEVNLSTDSIDAQSPPPSPNLKPPIL